jgi:hypothetical protein
MNINLTIFVQALNFLGAYCIIRLLLIKPGIRALEHDKKEIQDLTQAVTGKNSALEAQEAERIKRWRMCQHSLAQSMPRPVSLFMRVTNSDTFSVPDISPVQVAEQAREVEQYITKRLSDVRV